MSSRFSTPTATLALPLILACTLTATAPAARAYVDPTTGEPTARHVLRAFDPPEQNWLPGHRGVDLAAAVGQEILAAEEGTVAFAGSVAGTPTVSIDHADGIRTTYQPVHPWVTAGEAVAEGQPIGTLAPATGSEVGLSWGARRQSDDTAYVDPLSLLDAPAIRLKPVDAPAGRRP